MVAEKVTQVLIKYLKSDTNHIPISSIGIGLEIWTGWDFDRSEEHTSELQSQSNLVCRLLLEKKKTVQDGCAVPADLTYIGCSSGAFATKTYVTRRLNKMCSLTVLQLKAPARVLLTASLRPLS